MLTDKEFQRIYDELEPYLPSEWKKLVAYFEYGEASYSFSFYVKEGKNYIKCYDIPGIKESSLDKSFRKIDEFLSLARKTEEELWSNMTVVINNSGKIHADFDYTDLSGGSYQYKKNWKNKYLV